MHLSKQHIYEADVESLSREGWNGWLGDRPSRDLQGNATHQAVEEHRAKRTDHTVLVQRPGQSGKRLADLHLLFSCYWLLDW